MRMKNLETFYWIATVGSFRQASERLHTTQPAISARIAGLERDLGVTLFDRSARKVRLTAAGLEVLRYAEKILALSDEMAMSVGGAEEVTGVLRIGAAETLVHTWFPKLLVALSEAYPNLVVEAHVDITPNLREDLVRRDLDIAFLMGPLSEPSMLNREICAYPTVWVAGPDYDVGDGVLTKAEAAAHPIITFPRRTRPAMNVINAFRDPDLPPLKVSFASSLTAIFHLVESGFGLAAVPTAVVEKRLSDGTLRQVSVDVELDELAFTATYAATPGGPVVEAVADTAARLAAQNL